MQTQETEKPMGPVPASQPEENIKWVTIEEAEKFERMLFKNYVRIDPQYKKPHKDSKDYFYRIVSMHPSVPANIPTNTTQFTITFEVQKYFRNKTRKVNVRQSMNGATMEENQNEPVKRWVQNSVGDFVVNDADASFSIDARKFVEEFVPDSL